MASVAHPPDQRGQPVDTVVVMVDYAILEHFSKHLYGSPGKAVEELVVNSYDAWASRSYVYLPGKTTKSAVAVWDDGESMDISTLHKLWWIAKSPKEDAAGRIQERPGRGKRALIGKFGIGKLASYALGHRITHLCRRGGQFLRISVDYRDVPRIVEGSGEAPRYETPIVELTSDEARDYVRSLFNGPAIAESTSWDDASWTLAVIDELKADVDLKPGRLRWLLSNGMPLRPDFSVFVDDEPVVPQILGSTFAKWDIQEQKVRNRLDADWKAALDSGAVSGAITFGPDPDTGIPAVQLPNLGWVRADIRLFSESLLSRRSADIDRSYGFFIMVRDRLLNPEDPLFLLHDPSYGTFYRCQFVVHADGLDSDLLADRERVQANSARVRELELLIGGLYRAARQELETKDDAVQLTQRSESLLPIDSREHFQDPLMALLVERDIAVAVDPSAVRITRVSLAPTQPLSTLDPAGTGFSVNTSHPFFSVLSQRLGAGTKAKEALRAVDLLAVADLLLEGHLFDVGVDRDKVGEVLAWRDGVLRSIASRLGRAHEEIVHDVREASFRGKKEFEIALATLFESMGFQASRDGRSGEKDVLVVAPIGQAEYRLTIEAKGSQGPVPNDEADIGGAAAHRKEVGANLAVVVAREFSGFTRGRPAILKECDATNGQVSIATVEVIVELYEAIRRFAYPLETVLGVLQPVERPEEKLKRVHELQNPAEDFDFRGVLEEIWDEQKNKAAGDLVPLRAVMQGRPEWKKLGFKDFTQKLIGLQALAGGLIVVNSTKEVVILRQSPEVIAERIQRAVDRR